MGASLTIEPTLSNFRTSFLNNINPPSCLLCDQAGFELCPGCRADLPAGAAECCPQCALPSPQAQVCGHCLQSPPAFDRTLAAFRYGYPLDSVIHHFKYQRALWLAPPLAKLLQQSLPETPEIDALIAMPLDQQRLAERGFNQAHELARCLSRVYHLPLLTSHLKREHRPQHQADLPLAERAKQVKGIFSVIKPLPERVAIIDDVMTSGASINELARTLKKAGVKHVEAWVLARTYPLNE